MIEHYGKELGEIKMNDYRILKELLGLFLNDVEKGLDPRNAGWKEMPESEAQQLIEKGFCEKEGTKVRVAFRPMSRDILENLDEEGRWLADIHQEVVQAIMILDEIMRTVRDLVLQPAAIFLGWKHMLSTSSFPVVVDRILQEGFTTDKWVPSAIRASEALSLSVVKKWWNENEILNGLSKLSYMKESERMDYADKVMKVLKWDVVTDLFSKKEAVTLGLLWFADSKIKNLLYTESLVYIQSEVWRIIEGIIGENSELIRANIVKTVENVEKMTSEKDKIGRTYPIANWTFIIRVPW